MIDTFALCVALVVAGRPALAAEPTMPSSHTTASSAPAASRRAPAPIDADAARRAGSSALDPARERAAITEAIDAVLRGADLHQWSLVAAAFAPSVTLDYGTPETLTPTAIVARWQPLLESFDATQHRLTSQSITLDGDRATVSSDFVATHVLRGEPGGELWTLTGRYEHRLVRGARGWQITALRMIPAQSTGNTALLAAAQRRAASRTPNADAVATVADSAADVRTVTRVVDALFIATDAKDWATARTLFVAEPIAVDMRSLVGGDVLRMTGAQLIDGFAQGLHAGKASHHMTSNLRVDVRGDSASVFAHGYAWNRVAALPAGHDFWETWGTYLFTLRRTAGEWKLASFRYDSRATRGPDAVRTHQPSAR
ncbi:MAG: nuclear transport factor 2 family protein [Gemmatimonadaceae bacterium]|jgi:hypothetical protein|nr:nuclear transport factor 2 family protein [Gemmatimonadaceae bacterium]